MPARTSPWEMHKKRRGDLRLLLCGCGHVPESLVESVADSCSGESCCDAGGRPLVRLLIDGRP